MRNFFNPEKGIWRFFGFFGEFVMLSLLSVLCAAPVLTLGASAAALYDTVVHCTRRQEPDPLHRFFSTFKAELVSSLPLTLFCAAVTAGLIFLFRTLAASSLPDLPKLFLEFLFLLPIGILCWIFPLLSRFSMSFSELLRAAVPLALSQAFRSVLLALLLLLTLLVCARLIFPIMFLPAFSAWTASFLTEPVFEQYT